MFRFFSFLILIVCLSLPAFAEDAEKTATTDVLVQTSVFEDIFFLAGAIEYFIDPVSPELGPITKKEADTLLEQGKPSFHKLFYSGVRNIYNNKFVEASTYFKELHRLARLDGYKNLSMYSFQLLEIAKRQLNKENRAEARYLAREAIELSPEDARVYFAAATLGANIDGTSIFDYIRSGMLFMVRQPTILVTVGLNTLLVGLVAVTLSYLIVAVVQLATNYRRIFYSIAKILPRSFAGTLGPIFLLVLLAAPLYGGILTCIACWSVLLAVSLRPTRWLPLLAGVLILSWALSVRVISVASQNVHTPLNKALENAAALNYVPRDKTIIEDALEQNPLDPLLEFSYGTILLHEGNITFAKTYYEQALKHAYRNRYLRALSNANLGVIAYKLKDFPSALQHFTQAEADGVKGFELYRNMSLTYLAQADVANHRSYYTLLKDNYGDELREQENLEGDIQEILMLGAGRMDLIKRLFIPPPPHQKDIRMAMTQREEKLLSPLIKGGSWVNCMGLGIGMVVLGMLISVWVKGRRRVLTYEGRSVGHYFPSLVWLLMPGGYFAAGRNPITGVMIIASIMALAMLFFDAPVVMLKVFPFTVPIGNVALMSAVGLAILSSVGAIVTFRVRAQRG